MNATLPKKTVSIVGAGPVGALLATLLARRGYAVTLNESRPDLRNTNIYQGKSINIALSDRGWLALEQVGIAEQIKQHAIPMYKRIMHAQDGTLTEQAYGKNDQAIWSVSRTGINHQLLDLAEQEDNVCLHFNRRLTHIDFVSGCSSFNINNGHTEVDADLVFGADGANSKIRRLAQETPRFSYSQSYMPTCYIELTIPANKDGSHKLSVNALHIWPRKSFMLIALPNTDGTFTCTLFLDHSGKTSFSALQTKQQVSQFFQDNFADVLPILEDPVEQFMEKSANPLFLVNIDPWVINSKVALIGDAAHAMVPFYGQGLNCGFEDCRVLAELVDEHQHQWPDILSNYQQSRKKNADAITELAQRNFIEMSKLAGDSRFLLQKKIEAEFHQRHPELWTPLYSMVTFCPTLPYSEALRLGEIQQNIMSSIMTTENIEKCWQDDEIYQRMLQRVNSSALRSPTGEHND